MNKKRKKVFFFLFLFIIVGIIGTLFINLYIINSANNQIRELDKINKLDKYDAILVLGCKVNGNTPSLMLSRRLDKAEEVYSKLHTKILLSGDHGKNNYDEVNVMRDYLLDLNIKEEDIFLDHAGFSTYDSIYRAKYIFGVKKIIIITQKYHIYRALYLASKLDIEAVGIVASDIPQKGVMFKNNIREILSRDKSFIYGIIKPKSKYLGDKIPINGNGNVTNG